MEFLQERKKPITSTNGQKSGSFFAPVPVQAKLTVNNPGDIYEQEADTVAERVVSKLSVADSSPDSNKIPSFSTFPTTTAAASSFLNRSKTTASTVTPVQTKCADCEAGEKDKQEEEIQRKPESLISLQADAGEDEDESTIMAKHGLPSQPEVSPATASQLYASKGSGDPLPKTAKSEMERGFGTDFSNVRIHTGPSAANLSKNLGAQAFTHGSDIYFNSGKFEPQSYGGKKLLAHELTHVVQQRQDVQSKSIQRVALADFNSRYPGLVDEILDTSSDIDDFLGELNYSHSSVRHRTDVIRHRGFTYNLARINSGFSRAQQLYLLIDEAFVNERLSDQVNERLTFRWLQSAQRFIHFINGVSLATYVYPLYPTGAIPVREFPFALRVIHRRLAGIGRHSFIRSHGTEILEEIETERAEAPAEREERTTASIAQTIRHVRQYIRQHLNDIIQEEENQQYSDTIYAQAITNILSTDLGTDSARYLEFFRQLRSESVEMLSIIAFEGRLARNLFRLGIEGLEEIGELRGEGVQFAYHMVLGSWDFDEATGEEHASPNIALLFDVLVGVVPLVGQVADVRDITGYIYRMSKYDQQRSSWSTWLGLVGAIVGVIPALGDGAKSMMSGLRRGLSDMPVGRMSETVVSAITRHIDRRYLELLLDSSDSLTRSLTVNWVVMQGRVLNKWEQAITRYSPYMIRLTDLTSAQIAALRSAARERLPQILQDVGVLFREVIEALSRNISEELEGLMTTIRSLNADGRLGLALEEFERIEQEALEALRRGATEEAEEVVDDMRRMLGDEERISDTSRASDSPDRREIEERSSGEATSSPIPSRPADTRGAITVDGRPVRIGIRDGRLLICASPCDLFLERLRAIQDTLPDDSVLLHSFAEIEQDIANLNNRLILNEITESEFNETLVERMTEFAAELPHDTRGLFARDVDEIRGLDSSTGIPDAALELDDVRSSLHPRLRAEASPSQLLGEALEAHGDLRPAVGFHAHHIIPARLYRSTSLSPDIQRRILELHDALERSGLTLNGVENGVWLAGNAQVANEFGTILHLTHIHEDNVGYVLELHRRLEGLSPRDFRTVFMEIREEMRLGDFRFPRNPRRE
ncbi:hypothetical protein GCM10009119_21650 [Algoriphagus jejuensis]|uniref:eCIS core domain-containing protein n=1 Tax=Algoriphagus jejuensis TaxID=419934 RepID=A0ABP3YH37_9BACT